MRYCWKSFADYVERQRRNAYPGGAGPGGYAAGFQRAQVLRRLSGDWQAKYGHEIVLVETFVQRSRFSGTVYRAANWTAVGSSTGRTRQDRHRSIQSPVKDVYVYPLRQDFREVLCR